MSIIYKGLNPKHHYGLCILTKDGELITANGKHFQAIQIHTTHGPVQGRLINEFEKKLREYIDPYEIPGAMRALYEALDDAQQYIEVEG